MTPLKTIASLCLLLVISSCQRDKIEENSTITENEITEFNSSNKNGEEEESSLSHLERNLQWIAFVTAKVLTDSEEARGEFEAIAGGNDSIYLDNLLGDDSDALVFQDHFQALIGTCDIGGPRHERERPPHPIGSKSLPTDYPAEQRLADFYNFILNENCIEIYMPAGYTFEDNFTAASSAHPLTTAQENYGIQRFYNENEEVYNTTPIIMNIDYLNENPSNIFIARPFVDAENGCNYEEYEDVDFLDFMSN